MDLRVFNIHFTYIESENKTLCHHCKKKYAGKSMHNLKRHLTDKHQEQANDTNVKYREKRPASTSTADEAPPQKKLKKLVASDFIRSSVELVVLNLLPYSIFSMKAFKDLIYNHQVTTGITMNYCNAQKYVTETAKALKQKIKLEVKDRMIGLKVDVATRLGRSVLGINIQFFSEIERKILVRTIGMIEMHRRHTAENINLIISSLLGEYGIDKRSVASFTCDNGANIVATAKLFQNYQNSLLLCDELEELGQQLNDEEIDDEDDAENFDENGPLDIPSNIKDALKDITSVAVLVRCSIHTLQLCVHDSLNDIKKDYRNELDEIRKVVKNLKSSTYCEQIKSLKIKVPGIDVITRWNSSFIMIRKLINIQEDLNSLFEYFSGDALEKIKLETRHWTFMQKFYDAFLPCYNLTMKLQSSDVGMGDFYASWKKTMFDMKDNLEQNEFSKIVFDHMRQRSIKLFENNDILLASLYIDPRFNFNGRQFFSDTQNCRAEVRLG
ncbi:unnamed protein product [Chironomus riparius]|uniref:BED-type domain-containing protein n=1 Tax=Chironomus riparius TaxID=315576 RepID=A0A9N9RMH2_9DIPT|nr:unnamed protein product [Chironomus riparius]